MPSYNKKGELNFFVSRSWNPRSKLKYKNTLKDFIFPEDRATFLLGFHPNSNIQKMIHEGKIKEMKDLKFLTIVCIIFQ